MAKRINACVKCGRKGSEIDIWDCGYSSFNVGGAKCSCGNEVKLNSCGCFPRDEIIRVWNIANPVLTVRIQQLEKHIKDTKIKLAKDELELEKLKRELLDITEQRLKKAENRAAKLRGKVKSGD